MNRIRVVGLGNAWAGDDAIGLVAAERLQWLNLAGVEVLRLETPDWRMFDGLRAGDQLLIIDACRDGSPPGTLHELGLEQLADLPLRHCSSHGLGLADWLAMADTLGEDTGRLLVYAVNIDRTELGEPLSTSAERALEALLPQLKQKICELQERPGHA